MGKGSEGVRRRWAVEKREDERRWGSWKEKREGELEGELEGAAERRMAEAKKKGRGFGKREWQGWSLPREVRKK